MIYCMVFLIFAVVGGVIVVIQLFFSLLGIAADEVDFSDGHAVDHVSSSLFGILGIRPFLPVRILIGALPL